MPLTQTRSRFLERFSAMDLCAPYTDQQKLLAMVEEIRELKKQKNAVVLSHYYMPAELQIEEKDGGVADFTGDSLGLSVAATKVDAEHIVFCGVKFMAETAKILNPGKNVLIPNHEAGCSLAESITGADVRKLKEQYPGVPVVAYINTYAETKAECDICCTSRNALPIAKSFGSDQLIFLPDLFMGRNLQHRLEKETGKRFILWDGKCEVHEKFSPQMIGGLKAAYPEAEVLVHWEVPDEAVKEALSGGGGIVGSTGDILKFVGDSKARQFILGSECDLGATLRGMYPTKEFITPCLKCPHMKRITLENTLETLRAIGTPAEAKYLVTIPEEIRRKALVPIERMLQFV
ncbi:MAG: quinolinate synthase NadA [Chitinophagaceae bacterium]|nr:MAG: quinolinate synthase NadA [Chitinophagaceae bacterium]